MSSTLGGSHQSRQDMEAGLADAVSKAAGVGDAFKSVGENAARLATSSHIDGRRRRPE